MVCRFQKKYFLNFSRFVSKRRDVISHKEIFLFISYALNNSQVKPRISWLQSNLYAYFSHPDAHSLFYHAHLNILRTLCGKYKSCLIWVVTAARTRIRKHRTRFDHRISFGGVFISNLLLFSLNLWNRNPKNISRSICCNSRSLNGKLSRWKIRATSLRMVLKALWRSSPRNWSLVYRP